MCLCAANEKKYCVGMKMQASIYSNRVKSVRLLFLPLYYYAILFEIRYIYDAELKTWRIAQLFEKISPLDERRRCLLCGKIICNVRNHYYVHFPGKYSCNLCPAVYTRSDTLLMHSRSKHPEHVI
uniref:CSON007640 protein n=1 Tax=Culicoides sonorensis TaxID=179676 RepID=A0A336MV16_CULSO